MKTPRLILVGIALSVLSAPAQAFLGVGDIVFDPAAYAKLLDAYEQGQAQINILGTITGLSQQQVDTLNTINTAIGIAQGKIDPKALTFGQIAALSQGFGVDPGEISALYQQAGPFAGALDVFMGTSIDSFRNEQANPWKAYANWSTGSALGAMGTVLGLDSGEIALAKRIAALDKVSRANNHIQISVSLSALSAQRYANGSEQRRMAIQAEANISQQAAQHAAGAKSVNENAAAANEIAASTARLHAIAAQQQNEANEKLLMQSDTSNSLLGSMEERRAREQAQLLLIQMGTGNAY